MKRNKLIVFSAPSGAGKTTLVKHILSQFSNTNFSVSATSRSPRGNEKDGIDYHFLSNSCLLYTSPSPRDVEESRMPSSA